MRSLAMGIDLATASARCVVVDAGSGDVVVRADSSLPAPERGPGGRSRQRAAYAETALELVRQVCTQLGPDAGLLVAVSVTGTSGTVVPVDDHGTAVGDAYLYDDSTGAHLVVAAGSPGATTLGRVVGLHGDHPHARWASTADVVNTALTNGPVPADASHWLKAGIDLATLTWPRSLLESLMLPTDHLPPLVRPGTVVGMVQTAVARKLGLPTDVVVVGGMTDGCTAQVAAGAVGDDDTLGVLGTTLVLKAVSDVPIDSDDGGVYSHLAPDGRYWAGGASNSGAGVLATEFAGQDLAALDGQVAEILASHVRYPLSVAGERFPVTDRLLPSLTDGEPGTRLDAYRTVLEGVAFVERLGLSRLRDLGIAPRRHIIAGGATASPVWNRIRATVLAPTPVWVARSASSSVGAAILAAHAVTPGAFAETVARLTPLPEPVEPVAAQCGSLQRAYQRFVELLEGSLRHA
jgi:xylulokinase